MYIKKIGILLHYLENTSRFVRFLSWLGFIPNDAWVQHCSTEKIYYEIFLFFVGSFETFLIHESGAMKTEVEKKIKVWANQ
jgi:hypothetical protein